MFRQTVRTTNAHEPKSARVIATQLQSLGPKLARGYTASKCLSRYLLMKKVDRQKAGRGLGTRLLPDSNVALPPDCLAVKPCYRLALAIILLHPFLVRSISCFTFLCLTDCSLADAARFLFITVYCDGLFTSSIAMC